MGYDRVQLKQEAKAALSGKWGIAIGTMLVGGLILGISSFISFIFAGVIAMGLSFVYLKIVRYDSSLSFADMFDGFNHFGNTCLAGILVAIFTFLWSLLFFIPGIVKAYSYAMTPYILADNPDMSALDAINESKRMMYGHKWELFVLQLSFLGWIILCSLTFGILMLYVAPYMQAAEAKFYDTIKNQTVVI